MSSNDDDWDTSDTPKPETKNDDDWDTKDTKDTDKPQGTVPPVIRSFTISPAPKESKAVLEERERKQAEQDKESKLLDASDQAVAQHRQAAEEQVRKKLQELNPKAYAKYKDSVKNFSPWKLAEEYQQLQQQLKRHEKRVEEMIKDRRNKRMPAISKDEHKKNSKAESKNFYLDLLRFELEKTSYMKTRDRERNYDETKNAYNTEKDLIKALNDKETLMKELFPDSIDKKTFLDIKSNLDENLQKEAQQLKEDPNRDRKPGF